MLPDHAANAADATLLALKHLCKADTRKIRSSRQVVPVLSQPSSSKLISEVVIPPELLVNRRRLRRRLPPRARALGKPPSGRRLPGGRRGDRVAVRRRAPRLVCLRHVDEDALARALGPGRRGRRRRRYRVRFIDRPS